MTIAAVVTLIEIGGLLLVISVSAEAFTQITEYWQHYIPSVEWYDWRIIFAGSILAFYAFIGFEDMVVVAEEVKNVKRNLPMAILATLIITTILYALVMLAATLSLTPNQLANSQAPMAAIYEVNTGGGKELFGIISLFAVINGALIQLIMSSRMLYGLGCQKQLPLWLATIHPITRTPVWATLFATIMLMILTLIGTIENLARMTSLLMLVVFALVNVSLIRVKRHDPNPQDMIVFPVWVPYLGFIVSAGFVLLELFHMFA